MQELKPYGDLTARKTRIVELEKARQ